MRGQNWEVQEDADRETHLLPFRESVRKHVTGKETDISQRTSASQLSEPKPSAPSQMRLLPLVLTLLF